MRNRNRDIVRELSVNEKIEFLRGVNNWETKSDDRFNIKSIKMSDTSNGIRNIVKNSEGKEVVETSVCFPSLALLACSFDRQLIGEISKSIATEAKNKNINVILGPGINIKRSPLCGRNFEYFSEDPYLSGECALSYVKAMEKEGVGATLKHFAVNSTENERARINEVVDKRALHEIYLEPFKKVILNSKLSGVMTSYNKVNGIHTSENKYLLKDILRDTYQYKGLIMSDWYAVNDSIQSLKNGLDLEMPNGNNYNYFKLLNAYNDGIINDEDFDNPLDNILNYEHNYQNTHLDRPIINYDEMHELAIKASKESLILLKNDNNILPLSKNDTILILGQFAKTPHFQGKGSSELRPYKIEDLFLNLNEYTTHYTYSKGYDLYDSSLNKKCRKESINLAKNKDKVIIFIGSDYDEDAEGFDQYSSSLNINQIELINEISKINKNIIVVLESGHVKELPFIDNVSGLIFTYLGGEGINKALAETLFGINNPSGKLSETFFKTLKDHPTYNYLSNNLIDNLHKESIFVGYRYFVSYPQKVLFPFGYGLSYSNFTYSNINIDSSLLKKDKSIKISLKVKNESLMRGKDVIQIYIGKPNDKVFNPLKELKNFIKVELDSNEEKEVKLSLKYDDFSYYDISLNKFVVEKGNYKIYVSKDSLNDIKVFDIEIDGEEIVSPYLKNITLEKSDSLIENQYLGYKYFNKDIENISDDEFKEIDSSINISEGKVTYDYDSSISFACKNGSKGAKFISKLIRNYKGLKDKKDYQFFVLSSPIRMLELILPNIKDTDLDLLINIFNDKKIFSNLIKLLIKIRL